MDTVICKICKKSYANKGEFAVTCHVRYDVVQQLFSDPNIDSVLFHFLNLGNTTNLQFHLEKHHKHETETEANSEKTFVQTKVNSMPMQSKGRISREKKKTLDDLALKFIVGKAQSAPRITDISRLLSENWTQGFYFILLLYRKF